MNVPEGNILVNVCISDMDQLQRRELSAHEVATSNEENQMLSLSIQCLGFV